MRFAELTGPVIDSLSRDIPVLLPVARTVPRGPAFPVGIEAQVLEQVISQVADPEFLWLPTPPFAASPAFTGITGRLTTSPATFTAVISDILESLISTGFRRILVLTVEENLRHQVLPTLQHVRAENTTSLLFAASLQHLAAADDSFIGHVATSSGRLGAFEPHDVELPLSAGTSAFVQLNLECSTSGSILNPNLFLREEGARLIDISIQSLTSLLHQMSQPVTFQ